MKNIHISFMVLALSIASTSVQAADGTITINGRITTNTCTITNSINNSNNFTVELPVLPISTFTNAVVTAGDTPFSISLTHCPFGTVGVHFSDTLAANKSTNGHLTNIAPAGDFAEDIEIQILKNGTEIDLNTSNAGYEAVTINEANVVTGTTFTYSARYFASSDDITPGKVEAALVYTVKYN